MIGWIGRDGVYGVSTAFAAGWRPVSHWLGRQASERLADAVDAMGRNVRLGDATLWTIVDLIVDALGEAWSSGAIREVPDVYVLGDASAGKVYLLARPRPD